jgi:hypothetical protein
VGAPTLAAQASAEFAHGITGLESLIDFVTTSIQRQQRGIGKCNPAKFLFKVSKGAACVCVYARV